MHRNDKIIIYWDSTSKVWIAQSLNYGQLGGGKTIVEAIVDFKKIMRGYLKDCAAETRTKHCPAPQYVWDMAKNARHMDISFFERAEELHQRLSKRECFEAKINVSELVAAR